jgi:hypothetical protein
LLGLFSPVLAKVAVVHPAEFIVISFEQEQAKSLVSLQELLDLQLTV